MHRGKVQLQEVRTAGGASGAVTTTQLPNNPALFHPQRDEQTPHLNTRHCVLLVCITVSISCKKKRGKKNKKGFFMREGRVSKWCSAGSASPRRELGSLGDFCLLCLVSLTTSQFEFWPFT